MRVSRENSVRNKGEGAMRLSPWMVCPDGVPREADKLSPPRCGLYPCCFRTLSAADSTEATGTNTERQVFSSTSSLLDS